jgi:putrescine aminotransferase
MTPSPTQTFAALRRHVAPGVALGAKIMGSDAVEVEAQGATVRLSDGRELLDFGSYAVTLLGHRPPTVVAAVAKQLERMPTATRVLANPIAAELVRTLVERTNGRLERVWLGSDGADAVEVAIKLARRRTRRMRVLAVNGAFHGKTLGALALTANPAFRQGLEPLLANVSHLDPADPDAVAQELEGGDVACLIFEPIQGEAGVQVLDHEVLKRWSTDAHAGGVYVISDEIQAGLRRCGPFSLSLEHDLEPDAVLLGKALGGGVLPLSAVIASNDLYAPLAHDPTWHTSTFAGHPLSCAAGLAALEAIEECAAAARAVSAELERGLAAVAAERSDVIAAVRGAGLLWGIECQSMPVAGALMIALAQTGLLVSPCLSAPDTLRLMPPMVTTSAEVDRAISLLADGLDAARIYASDELHASTPIG